MRGGKTDLHRFNGPSLQHLCDSSHKLAIMPTLFTEKYAKKRVAIYSLETMIWGIIMYNKL